MWLVIRLLLRRFDTKRRIVKSYISYLFLSALLLLFIEAGIAATHGVWLSEYVAGFGYIWIFFSMLTLWMCGGRYLDGTIIASGLKTTTKDGKIVPSIPIAKEAMDAFYGFFAIEGTIVNFFYFIPTTWSAIFMLIVAIMAMYCCRAIMGEKFNWNYIFWPILVTSCIGLVISVAISTGFMQRPGETAKLAEYAHAQTAGWNLSFPWALVILGIVIISLWMFLKIPGKFMIFLGGLAVVIGLVFVLIPKSQPGLTKTAGAAGKIFSSEKRAAKKDEQRAFVLPPAPLKSSSARDIIIPSGLTIAVDEGVEATLEKVIPKPSFVRWRFVDQYGVKHTINWTQSAIEDRKWDLVHGKVWPDRVFMVSIELPAGTEFEVDFRKIPKS